MCHANRFAVGLRFDLSRVGSSARLVYLYHSTLFFSRRGVRYTLIIIWVVAFRVVLFTALFILSLFFSFNLFLSFPLSFFSLLFFLVLASWSRVQRQEVASRLHASPPLF